MGRERERDDDAVRGSSSDIALQLKCVQSVFSRSVSAVLGCRATRDDESERPKTEKRKEDERRSSIQQLKGDRLHAVRAKAALRPPGIESRLASRGERVKRQTGSQGSSVLISFLHEKSSLFPSLHLISGSTSALRLDLRFFSLSSRFVFSLPAKAPSQ